MTEQEHMINHLSEEGVEVSQRVSKALRFGLTEVQPGQPHDNAMRITLEAAEFLSVLEMCVQKGYIPPVTNEMIAAKRPKVEKYLAYSRSIGMVSE